MKCKWQLLLCALAFWSQGISQKNIIINIAPTFSSRGILLELKDYPNGRINRSGYTNIFDRQFEVKQLGIDVGTTSLNKKLTIQLSTYFRYGFLYYDKILKEEKKAFKADVIADLFYNFKKKHPWSFGFYAGAGVGRVNMGTHFKYAYIEAVDSTGPYYKVGEGNFSFTTIRIVVGITKGRWNLSLSGIGAPDSDKRRNLSISAEPKISYRLFSIKISVKSKT